MKNITSFDKFLNESEEIDREIPDEILSDFYKEHGAEHGFKSEEKFYSKMQKALKLEDWFTKWGIKDPEKALTELNELGFKITHKKKPLFQK